MSTGEERLRKDWREEDDPVRPTGESGTHERTRVVLVCLTRFEELLILEQCKHRNPDRVPDH